MPEWTLLGEYTGVWDSQERSLQRISGDPMGLGTMRRDKVTELAYAGEDVSEDVHKGAPHSCSPALKGPNMWQCVRHPGIICELYCILSPFGL